MKIPQRSTQPPLPANIIRLAQHQDIFKIVSDRTSEEALIGTALQQPDIFPALNDRFKPEHFFYGFTRLAWIAMQKLSEAGDGIDISTVPQKMQELKPTLITDLADTNMRLVNIISKAPLNANPETYQKNIKRAALRLAFMQASDDMAALAQDLTKSEDALIEGGERILYDLTQRDDARGTHVFAAVNAYYDQMEALANKPHDLSIKTGFDELDGRLGGLIPGNVNVLAGSEGMGKTTLMLTMVRQMCKAGKGVALFTLEMSQEEIIQAFVAMETGVNKMTLKTGSLNPADWEQFTAAVGEISRWNLHVVDEFPTLTPLQLRRKLRRIMVDMSVDVVAIDGLWLMEPTERAPEGRWRDVFTIMRDLTELAKAPPHGVYVPILITHQYNSEVKDAAKNAPNLYWLSESAGVRRNAQVVLAMHRAGVFDLDTYDPNTPEPLNLYILKDRNGRSQGEKLVFTFDRQFALYREEAKRYDPADAYRRNT